MVSSVRSALRPTALAFLASSARSSRESVDTLAEIRSAKTTFSLPDINGSWS